MWRELVLEKDQLLLTSFPCQFEYYEATRDNLCFHCTVKNRLNNFYALNVVFMAQKIIIN